MTGRETCICGGLQHLPPELPLTFPKLIRAVKQTNVRESRCQAKSNAQHSFGADCRSSRHNSSVRWTSQVILTLTLMVTGESPPRDTARFFHQPVRTPRNSGFLLRPPGKQTHGCAVRRWHHPHLCRWCPSLLWEQGQFGGLSPRGKQEASPAKKEAQQYSVLPTVLGC